MLMKNMEKISLALLRKDYSRAALSEIDLPVDPLPLFTQWFDEARLAQLTEPNAMSVATVAINGRPSSRILLIKEFDQRGFTWFTNYQSRKSSELQGIPYASLLFHWGELERQVRIEGQVERLTSEESDRYFEKRPLDSRLGAIASQQSRRIESRALLDQAFEEVKAQYGDHPPRPPHWGGYRLIPDRMEFWQGRPSRLHDRIVYTRSAGEHWSMQRLQP
jgi:pyridoxamine 5'-phosphate oxidase